MLIKLDDIYDLYHWKPGTVIDVRSPGEYHRGHWPGAVNIPLLNDEKRELIGKTYKAEGHFKAVQLGFELAGGHFHHIIKESIKVAETRPVFLYCSRGGLRSEIVEWMLEKCGLQTKRLIGGYKTLRHAVLQLLEKPWPLRVLGGNTGSGKTEVLQCWEEQKLAQVIDLEGLACHRGSAFGALGQCEQPSTEHFENMLAFKLLHMMSTQPIWLEDESRMIGKVKIPDAFFDRMKTAPWVALDVDFDKRKQRILSEYGRFSHTRLSEATVRVRKRLGNLRLTEALNALDQGDLPKWAGIMLAYYDKTYAQTLAQHKVPEEVSLPYGRAPECKGAARLYRQLPATLTHL